MLIINELAFSQDSIVVYYNRDFKGERPKLGLVLSGGGAKGIAHVGVLKVMEKVGLKPDYIAGTSMGSIVGGLYAIGFSADSLERLIEEQDWTNIFSNKLNLLNVNMEEKWDYGEYIAEFPFNGWKPGLPQGAIKGQELEALFNKLTVSVAGDTNFDDFYIPYRAVAVDILKGEPYVFNSGSLAFAMRSSMSIPTIMNPVKFKDKLFVDGGLINNFPVDVCKNMGADIIIGVYTGGELMPADKLNTLFSILKQSSMLAGIKNAERQRKEVDLYIEPDVSELNAADFNAASIFIDRGFEAASSKIDDFKRMAVYFRQFPNAEKPRPRLTDSVFVVNTKFNSSGAKTMSDKLIENAFKRKIEGEWLTPDDIKSQIDFIYGTRLFKKITYNFEPSKENANALILNYNVQKENDKYLTFAIQYKSESSFGINLGLKYRNFLINGSKVDLKFRLSQYPAFRARYFSYLGYKTKNGLDINYLVNTDRVIFYQGSKKSGDYRMLYNIFGTTYHRYFSRNSEFFTSLNTERIIYRKNLDITNFSYSKIKTTNNNLSLGYKVDKLDNKYFTQKGSKLTVGAKFYWNNYDTYFYDSDSVNVFSEHPSFKIDSANKFISIGLDYTNFLKITPKLIIENNLNLLASFKANYSTLNAYWIGGVNVDPRYQYAFWGLPENYNMFYNGWIYRIGFRYNFYDKIYIGAKANLMFSAKDITKILDTSLDPIALDSYFGYYDNYLFGMGLQLSYESLIGPISVTVTKGSNNSTYWWHILFGYKF